MAEESNDSNTALPKMDAFYNKIAGYVASKVSNFVAFIFFVFTLGVVFGSAVVQLHPGITTYAIIAPAVLGLIAYYNRAFATAAFIVFIAIVLLF